MRAILYVIDLILQLYIWLLIAAAVLSWLIAFNVVNTRNQFVAMVGDFLYRITEPVLRPIRNMLPNLGGIDISPVIVILIIIFLRPCDRLLHLFRTFLTSMPRPRPWTVAAGGLVVTVRLTPQGRARRHRRHRDSCADGQCGAQGAGARRADRRRGERRADRACSPKRSASHRAMSSSSRGATSRIKRAEIAGDGAALAAALEKIAGVS